MSARLETFLARLHVHAETRLRFLQDPRKEAAAAGLAATEIEAMVQMDRTGLEMAATSLLRKKQKRKSGI
jgi:hypothetical protein